MDISNAYTFGEAQVQFLFLYWSAMVIIEQSRLTRFGFSIFGGGMKFDPNGSDGLMLSVKGHWHRNIGGNTVCMYLPIPSAF